MDVGSWLRGLGLGRYEEKFRENKINLDVLADLTDRDLQELGVPIGDRRRLLRAIAELGAQQPLAPQAQPPAAPTPAQSFTQLDSAERRPITVMFCDLVGSTELAAALDVEDWRNLLNSYLDEASKAVTALGGHVLKMLGDGLMAVFGYPRAQENDAERAVRAALRVQQALSAVNARNAASGAPQLAVRIGLESGPVVVDAAGEVFGEVPSIAARVQAAAEPGTVLVTSTVQRQVAGLFIVEDKGAYELKGALAPMNLFRILRISGGRRRRQAQLLTSFVGREEDLAILARCSERAFAGAGQFVMIAGEPGIGKSRLVEEFRGQLAERRHSWIEWSSSQLLQNTPLHPVLGWARVRFGGPEVAPERRLAEFESVLAALKLDPATQAPLLAPLIDIPVPLERLPSLPPEEIRRRQLAAMVEWGITGARNQPLVLVLEDLQWFDPTSIDLVHALSDRCAQAPILVLATARSEFRPPWGSQPHHTVISLAPLDEAQVQRIIAELAVRRTLLADVMRRVSERAGGVPLFVEEVTRLLLERGQPGLQAIPPTLQQSLAARLDQLGEAREVAQIGAVLGRDFTYILLRAVGGIDDSALQSALDRLAEADLLIAEGAGHEANYRFKHALIQDAAYDSLLKSSRQALHRRAAEILVGQREPAAAEPEVIAHHFTQGGLDELAIEWWGKAGDQALHRSAFQEAIAHLDKAIAMADQAAGVAAGAAISTPQASQRVKLQNDYAQAVSWSKGYAADETKAAFERTSALAARAELPAEQFSALYGRAAWSWARGEFRAARGIAERFLREAEAEGRLAEARVAHIVLGVACMQLGDLREARTQLELGLSRFEELGSGLRERFGLDGGASARAFLALTMWLSGNLSRGRELIEEATRFADERGHPPTTATVLIYKIAIEVARNDFESVVVDAENFLKISQQHSMGYYLALSRLYLSLGLTRLGGAQRVDDFRQSLADYRDQGNRVIVPGFLGVLARLEAAAQNYERALALIDEALAMSQEGGDRLYDSNLHRLRGNILLKREPANPAQAEDAFKTSLAIAKQQGARTFELLASFALAKLYQATGRLVEAHAVLKPALEGFSPTPEMPVIAKASELMAAIKARGCR